MKSDEIKFFRLCFKYITKIDNEVHKGKYTPRDLINILEEWLPHKRAWYYLDKWDSLGFYNYGVTSDLGWLEIEKIPERYLEVLNND